MTRYRVVRTQCAWREWLEIGFAQVGIGTLGSVSVSEAFVTVNNHQGHHQGAPTTRVVVSRKF